MKKKYKNPPSLLTETFSEKEIEEANRKGQVLMMDIETNRTCNLRCNYCFIGKMNNVNLSFEKIRNIIDQAKDAGLRNINIIGGGEPTLYRDGEHNLLDIIDYINGKGISIQMFTNGIVFGYERMAEGIFKMNCKELSKKFFEKKVTVILSIKSEDQDTYDKIVGVHGKYEQMKQGLRNLMEAGFTRDVNKIPQLVLETVITRQSYKEVPDLLRFVRKNNMVPYFEIVRMAGSAKKNERTIALPNEKIKELFEKLRDIDRNEFGYDWTPIPPHICFICDLNRYNIYVTIDGIVYNCESFALKFGNIFRKPLKEILKNPDVKKIRDIAKNIGGRCKTCDHMKNGECFGGCVGQAYSVSGSAFSGDPVCWHNAKGP